MRKIPTMFERDWDGDRSSVVDRQHADCGWVFAGEGIATQKVDGTCCLIRGGKLFKRRELKPTDKEPSGFEVAGVDAETGKRVGWVPVTDDAGDKWHREAFNVELPDGTYELLGPKIQGNPEKVPSHRLVPHGSIVLENVPREFHPLSAWMRGKDIEGIVFHHPDGRMAKIKLRDFGIKRP